MSTARTVNRLTRILSMLPWVIAHPGARVDEVCGRFGYTRSELLADLDLVFVCGLPGYGPGDLMVAYVEDDRVVVDVADYFAAAPRLTAAEALGLLASGMTVLTSGLGSDALESAVEKLTGALLGEGEAVTVDVATEPDLAAGLRRAAAEGRVVRLTYTTLSRGDTTVREIEPWSVFSSLGNWYVSAWCRSAQGERVFRLDRIRAADVTGESFTPPAEIPPPQVRYTPSEDDVRALIALAPEARWVLDYYPVEVVEAAGDTLTVRFSSSDPSVTAGLLLRLGSAARLLEGDEVAESLAALREGILARYGG